MRERPRGPSGVPGRFWCAWRSAFRARRRPLTSGRGSHTTTWRNRPVFRAQPAARPPGRTWRYLSHRRASNRWFQARHPLAARRRWQPGNACHRRLSLLDGPGIASRGNALGARLVSLIALQRRAVRGKAGAEPDPVDGIASHEERVRHRGRVERSQARSLLFLNVESTPVAKPWLRIAFPWRGVKVVHRNRVSTQ